MKKFLIITLFLGVLFQLKGFAQKPIDQWMKEDILAYFKQQNIYFEGEYINKDKHQIIIIGITADRDRTINYNFYLSGGFLNKALITTSQPSAFQLISREAENNGFLKTSESHDQLGNTYWKYSVQNVELIIINKYADWPEVYFRP